MIITDRKAKVLKMYVAEYPRLDEEETAQLRRILKEIYQVLEHHPERNFIFWGNVYDKVVPILKTNGFTLARLHVEDVHLLIPIIRWNM